MVEQQRRGRAIAMSADEVDSYLAEQRTCRVATVGHDGRPHVSALWFVWDGADLWLNSLSKSQRWTDLRRDPRVRSEEHTSELQSLMRISYAVFCLKKKK